MIRHPGLGLQGSERRNTASIKLCFTSLSIIAACVSLNQPVASGVGYGVGHRTLALVSAHWQEGAVVHLSPSQPVHGAVPTHRRSWLLTDLLLSARAFCEWHQLTEEGCHLALAQSVRTIALPFETSPWYGLTAMANNLKKSLFHTSWNIYRNVGKQ